MKLTKSSALLALILAAATAVPANAEQTNGTPDQCGRASWYAMTSRTASGERANPEAMVAAHRTLPFGTMVRVENLNNGREVVVRINDRGPFIRGRIIDLSRAAANELGFVRAGTAAVRVSVVAPAGAGSAACS